MKIVLNRKEVMAYKNLFDKIDAIEGVQTESIDLLKNQILTTKSMVITLITGKLTIEIPEDLTVSLVDITADFVSDSTPVIRAMCSLVGALQPATKKFTESFKQLAVEYADEEPQWQAIDIQTEREAC